MKKPMTTFKVETEKKELHSFIPVRRGVAYAENGVLKTYTNHKQAQKKVDELTSLGFEVSYTLSHPFLIVPL